MDIVSSTPSWPDLVGFAGVGLLLLAYFMLQNSTLSSKSIAYSLLNLLAALLILVSLAYSPNIPSIVIEIIWALISLYGLMKALKLKA